jgi:hypothetical protein
MRVRPPHPCHVKLVVTGRLKQLYEIAGRIDEKDLRCSGPRHDVVAEP